jgi:glutaredoxin
MHAAMLSTRYDLDKAAPDAYRPPSGIESIPHDNPCKESPVSKATFFHAGCPVCLSAETAVAKSLDPARYQVEVVHLGKDKARLPQAEKLGVKSVPALVLDGKVFHINFGAALSDLK